MSAYAIRYLDSDPYGRGGAVVGDFDTHAEAQEIAHAIPNYAHVEVVER